MLPLAEVGRGDLAPLAEAGRPVAIRVTLARRDRWRAETIEREVFVRRTGFGRPEECFEALSPICPHAGCLVRLENDGAGFLCPCHRAVFDSAGRLVDGPSPRALDVLPVSVGSYEGEPWLFVQWQGFASGGEQGAARG